MPRQPSGVGALFNKKDGGSNSYECKLCGKIVVTSEQTKSNLNRHIKKHHPGHELTLRDGRSTPGQPGPDADRMRRFAGASKAPQMSKDGDEYTKITRALTQFVASSYMPLAVVESPTFRDFVASLNPRYPVPYRTTLRKQLLDAAGAAQERLRHSIRRLPADRTVALTMDLWSNRQLLSFIGMTLHVTGEHGLSTHLLCFRRFPERHTADNIVEAYESVIAEYDLGGRVSLLVTDSASNMMKAFRVAFAVPSQYEDEEKVEDDDDDGDDELEVTRLDEVDGLDLAAGGLLPRRVSCCAHTLQLVIQDALRLCGNRHGGISKALARLNSFISAARHSTLGMEILKKAQCSLSAPNVTRWNSQLRAVESFLRLQDPVLEQLRQLEKLRAKCPTEGDRVILKEVCMALGPFSAATDVLQGDRVVTASHVVPTLVGLRCALTSTPQPTTSAARQLREELAKSLERRFVEVVKDPLYVTATVLDPRFKLLPWASQSQGQSVEEVQDACLQHLEAEFSKRPLVPAGGAPGPAAAAASTSSRQPAEVDVVQLSDDSDVDEPMALAAVRPSSAGSTPRTTESVATSTWGSKTSLYGFMRSAATPEPPPKSPIAKELATFLLEPALPQDADPLAFWSGRRAVYPHLEVAAKNALAVPASSGPSERVFSMSGKMFSPARSRLSGDLAEALMHVRCAQ